MRKNLISIYLFPILIAFLFEAIFKGFELNRWFNLIENTLFAFILIAPEHFILNKNLKIYYVIISFLLFTICVYFETAYYYLFNATFSPSSIFVAFDSNVAEAKEFIDLYLDLPIVLVSLLFLFALIPVFRKRRRGWTLEIKKTQLNALILVDILILSFFFLKESRLIDYNLPYLVVRSNIEYYHEARDLDIYKNNTTGDFQNVSRIEQDDDELYVIIIGESTSRLHLGIYDYYRQTTPELNKIKDQLLVYDDVISPHAYSIGAMTKILTLGNYENPEKIDEGSIIQLINKSGFDTYWLSNQRPVGPYESLITKISLSSKNHKFITTTIAGKNKVFDGDLIGELDNVLNQEGSKKVVFLHLIGTHHHYKNRYPREFGIFNDVPRTEFKSRENYQVINHFDNAVLYNDYLITEVIKKVDSMENRSFVLYFSDHGEEVFDQIDLAGHNEDVYSQNMFDIPFILWRSDTYKQAKDIYFVKDRRYMIDDLFHGISDLLDIKAPQTDSTRSIFSEYFVDRKRIIKDTINYDTFFNRQLRNEK
jgi:heptose-I-phosphate ethanolaminephosphotransferase